MGFNFVDMAIGFVGGVLTTIVGPYVREILTDKRRNQEKKDESRSEFADVERTCYDLLKEMRKDLRDPDSKAIREFFILEGGILNASSQCFVYDGTPKNRFLSKARILEGKGYVVDITPSNVPMFRMTEEFVKLLLE